MRDSIGQLITFATEIDPDAAYSNFIWVRVTAHARTIREIAAKRGHPEMAAEIAGLNGIRSITQKLKIGRKIKIPGTLEQKLSFEVHAQDSKPPTIKDGYAIFDVVDRYGEKGLTHFKGYNPWALDVPVTFEAWSQQSTGAGLVIEDKIKTLERMAGRGLYAGTASGPPAVIRVSVTDNAGVVVPLIPYPLQWTPQATTGLTWRINGIDWDENALRDSWGRRVRQDAVIHLFEETPITLATTLTERAKRKGF